MTQRRFTFRPMTEKDLPLLSEWFSRPHLQKWWREQVVSVSRLREKYLPRISGKDDAKPFIICMNGSPVGYIQYYQAWINKDWWPDTPKKGSLGIDQFIASEDQLGQGMGREFISRFIQILMTDPSVIEIRVDPHPDNIRAIRCYENLGFVKKGNMITPDGSALLMIYSRIQDE